MWPIFLNHLEAQLSLININRILDGIFNVNILKYVCRLLRNGLGGWSGRGRWCWSAGPSCRTSWPGRWRSTRNWGPAWWVAWVVKCLCLFWRGIIKSDYSRWVEFAGCRNLPVISAAAAVPPSWQRPWKTIFRHAGCPTVARAVQRCSQDCNRRDRLLHGRCDIAAGEDNAGRDQDLCLNCSLLVAASVRRGRPTFFLQTFVSFRHQSRRPDLTPLSCQSGGPVQSTLRRVSRQLDIGGRIILVIL